MHSYSSNTASTTAVASVQQYLLPLLLRPTKTEVREGSFAVLCNKGDRRWWTKYHRYAQLQQ